MPPLLSVSTFRKATSLSTTLAVFRVCGPLGDRMLRSTLPRGSYTKRTSVQGCRLDDEPAALETISLALTGLKTCFLEEPKGRINAKSLDHRRSNYSPHTQTQLETKFVYISCLSRSWIVGSFTRHQPYPQLKMSSETKHTNIHTNTHTHTHLYRHNYNDVTKLTLTLLSC